MLTRGFMTSQPPLARQNYKKKKKKKRRKRTKKLTLATTLIYIQMAASTNKPHWDALPIVPETKVSIIYYVINSHIIFIYFIFYIR